MSNADRWSGYGYVFFGLSFVAGFLALVDWAADGHVIEYALDVWASLPEFVGLTIVCLFCGVAVVFGLWGYLVWSAEPVDENYCPLEVKGKK